MAKSSRLLKKVSYETPTAECVPRDSYFELGCVVTGTAELTIHCSGMESCRDAPKNSSTGIPACWLSLQAGMPELLKILSSSFIRPASPKPPDSASPA